MTRRYLAFAASSAAVLFAVGARAQALQLPARETIVFVRHGEKPDLGFGQLSCQGRNRALALPAVLQAKVGAPAALFAPDPAEQKEDAGKSYSYVRPLATIEPAAIRFGLPVDVHYGFRDIDKLKLALEQPIFHRAVVVVAWEHHMIDALATSLMATHGGGEEAVPKWHSADFDGIYVVAIDWSVSPAKAVFARERENLDGLSQACPR